MLPKRIMIRLITIASTGLRMLMVDNDAITILNYFHVKINARKVKRY